MKFYAVLKPSFLSNRSEEIGLDMSVSVFNNTGMLQMISMVYFYSLGSSEMYKSENSNTLNDQNRYATHIDFSNLIFAWFVSHEQRNCITQSFDSDR